MSIRFGWTRPQAQPESSDEHRVENVSPAVPGLAHAATHGRRPTRHPARSTANMSPGMEHPTPASQPENQLRQANRR